MDVRLWMRQRRLGRLVRVIRGEALRAPTERAFVEGLIRRGMLVRSRIVRAGTPAESVVSYTVTVKPRLVGRVESFELSRLSREFALPRLRQERGW